MIPIGPGREFDGHSDPVALAGQMLALVDESPDRAAVFELPIDARTPAHRRDAMEASMICAYDAAKAWRPNLAVRLHYRPLRAGDPPRLLIEIHEHLWRGGRCVCGQNRGMAA